MHESLLAGIRGMSERGENVSFVTPEDLLIQKVWKKHLALKTGGEVKNEFSIRAIFVGKH